MGGVGGKKQPDHWANRQSMVKSSRARNAIHSALAIEDEIIVHIDP